MASPDKPRDRLINREASWLDFNERVLSLAADSRVPLLERLKFLAIHSGNLDEFYEVRVAGLKDQAAAGVSSVAGGGPLAQLELIAERVKKLTDRQSHMLHATLLPALREQGIEVVSWDQLDDDTRTSMTTAFEDGIFPVLTPLAVDPGHPFPYISNKSLNLAVVIREGDETRFARVKVPPLLPRFIPIGQHQFLPLEDLVAAHIGQLFPSLHIISTHTFRVTRNADLSVSDGDADDLLAAVETELRRRRFGRAVRIEISSGTPKEVLDLLLEELELGPDDVTEVHGLLDLTSLWAIHGLPRPELKDEPWTPVTRPAFSPNEFDSIDLFGAIREADILVHHPYDSFASSVEAFIRQAANDPAVLTIKMTLYRTSGNSPIARALIEAAEKGKQVAVLIELKARFDEQANIAWAKAMEEVGIHVAYGVVGLKTHAKVALVVRAEERGLRRYCHIGTGNYNSSTARLYEDLGIFTADPAVGADLTKLFNTLTGFGRSENFERIVVAPNGMRSRILELIAGEHPNEHHGPGRVVMKLNSLVDPDVIDALYAASQAGVAVDLIIRGICCLRAQVPGLSENIRVRSNLGRYLEHSRVFHFSYGNHGEALWMIGSADMMQRNLDGRVETLVPILQSDLVAELADLIATLLRTDTRGWELDDAVWVALHQSPEGQDHDHPVVDAQHARFEALSSRIRKARRHVLATQPNGTTNSQSGTTP
jgi:polyphosphate kinase